MFIGHTFSITILKHSDDSYKQAMECTYKNQYSLRFSEANSHKSPIINGLLGYEEYVVRNSDTESSPFTDKDCKHLCQNADPNIETCQYFEYESVDPVLFETEDYEYDDDGNLVYRWVYGKCLLYNKVPGKKDFNNLAQYNGTETKIKKQVVGPVFCPSETVEEILESEITSGWRLLVTCDEGPHTCSYARSVGISTSDSESSTDSSSHTAHVDFRVTLGIEGEAGVIFAKVKTSLEASIGGGKLYFELQ